MTNEMEKRARELTELKEHPILFCPENIRAILAGKKTQTRRVIEHPEYQGCLTGDCPHDKQTECDACVSVWAQEECPYGKPLNHLWVRESWFPVIDLDGKGWAEWEPDPDRPIPDDGYNAPEEIMYKATDDFHPQKWRSAIFMPRWACRIILEITGVRVERVQSISEADALAEGVDLAYSNMWWQGGTVWTDERNPAFDPKRALTGPRAAYGMLWDRLNQKRGFPWSQNPWVWVLEFKKL